MNCRFLFQRRQVVTRFFSSSSVIKPSDISPVTTTSDSKQLVPITTSSLPQTDMKDGSVIWKWLPPPTRPVQTLEEESKGQNNPSVGRPKLRTNIDPIPHLVHVSKEEIMQSFILHGATNVIWKPCGNLAEAMVFATGRSNAHARMLAQVVVRATKDRGLNTFNKYKTIEGVDDWFFVDTGRLMVNCFSGEKKRREVDLEGHLDDLAAKTKVLKEKWGAEVDPSFLSSELEKMYQKEDLLVKDGTETIEDEQLRKEFPHVSDDTVHERLRAVEMEEKKERRPKKKQAIVTTPRSYEYLTGTKKKKVPSPPSLPVVEKEEQVRVVEPTMELEVEAFPRPSSSRKRRAMRTKI